MIKKNILFKKIIDHFSFLKKAKNLSELLSKNLPLDNKNNVILPLAKINYNLKLKNTIKNRINKLYNKKNNIIFFSLNNNFKTNIIIVISIDSNLQLTFSILQSNNNLDDVLDITKSLIKYFRDTIYFNKYVFDNTFSKKIISKVNSSNILKRKKNILTAGPSVSLLEIFNTYKASRYGWNNNWSDYIEKFEKKFAEYLGVKHALCTSSCTGALQIALLTIGIKKDDEVIVPDLTWVSTATAVRDLGAKPVFADVELDSWNIDYNSILKKITKKTKAIIVVHLYGHPARMDKIVKLAKTHNIKIIEDAAPAIGAEWKNKKCGTFGSFAAFSFQGAKLLVTGEGGMLVTNNTTLYKKAHKIWNQGRNPNIPFWIDEKGLKFKMSNLQAAFGYAQISRVHEQIQMKRRIFNWYYEKLKKVDCINLNHEVENAKSIYWMTSFFINDNKKISRNKIISKLRSFNIDTRPVFPSISQYPIWHKNFTPQKNSLLIGNNSINLPSGITLTENDVSYISKILVKTLTNK